MCSFPVYIQPSDKAIRKAFVARLIAQGIAGGNVVSTRGYQTAKEDAPVVNVFCSGSESTSRSHAAHFDRLTRVMCVGTVVVPRSTDLADMDELVGDLVDDLEVDIVDAVMTWRELSSSMRMWAGKVVQKGVSADGEDLRGEVAVEFRFHLDEGFAHEAPITGDGVLNVLDLRITPGTIDRTPDYHVRVDAPP